MKTIVKHAIIQVFLVLVCAFLTGCPICTESQNSWAWKQNGNVFEVAYGNKYSGWPQMAALHVNTGALRLIYGPGSGWGPTVYIPPSLWTLDEAGEEHHLGAAVTGSVAVVKGDLVLELEGTVGGLPFSSTVRFSPPVKDRFEAYVSVATAGSVPLADRPGEAFKPVQTATMIISDTEWDSHAVRIDSLDYPLPFGGWVLDPPGVLSDSFTLVGGSSLWKPNGPSITVILDRPMPLQGWVAESLDPNDDNVGFWCASETVLDSWDYRILATP